MGPFPATPSVRRSHGKTVLPNPPLAVQIRHPRQAPQGWTRLGLLGLSLTFVLPMGGELALSNILKDYPTTLRSGARSEGWDEREEACPVPLAQRYSFVAPKFKSWLPAWLTCCRTASSCPNHTSFGLLRDTLFPGWKLAGSLWVLIPASPLCGA